MPILLIPRSAAGAPPATLPGLLTAVTVEIEFTAGIWTDVSNDVAIDQGLVIAYPNRGFGSSPTETITPGTLNLVMRNAPDKVTGVANYMPDNPLSPFFPNVVKGKRIRVTCARGTTVSVRFGGWIDAWVPSSGSNPGVQTVAISASDVLGQMARQLLRSEFTERHLQRTDPVDMWMFDEDVNATTFSNVGHGNSPKVGTLYQNSLGSGDFSVIDPTGDGGVYVDGALQFGRDATGGSSPAVLLPLQDWTAPDGPVMINFLSRIDAATTGYDDLIVLFDYAGNPIARFGASPVGGVTEWAVANAAGTVIGNTVTGGDPFGTKWRGHALYYFDSAGTPCLVWAWDGSGTGLLFAGIDMRNTRYISVGGYMSPFTPGKVLNSVQGAVTSISVDYKNSGTSVDRVLWAQPTHLRTVNQFAADLISYSPTNPFSSTALGGDGNEKQITARPTKGRSVLDLWSQLAITVGGLFEGAPSGRAIFWTSKPLRPTFLKASLDAQADLHLASQDLTWASAAETKPTQVIASSSSSSFTATDPNAAVANTNQVNVETIAPTRSVNSDVASFFLNVGGGMRPTQVPVDIVLATNDVASTLWALHPGDRVRLSNFPPGQHGLTYADFFVAGVTETYTESSAMFVMSGQPADAPPEAVLDDAIYGRLAATPGSMTVTGGTCLGGTGTGTVIVTTSGSNPRFTTDGSAYPMDLNWNGERITVSGVGGGTSPQTLTVAARGVAPAVARAHAAGETIDVWQSATVAF